MLWFEVIGLLVASVGGAVGLIGFAQTFWKYNARERLLDPIWNAVKALTRWLRLTAVAVWTAADSRIRELLGRPRPLVLKGAVNSLGSIDLAVIRAPINTSRPLPQVVRDLQEQTSRLVKDQVGIVDARVEKLEAITNDVAADGIRIPFLGLFMVAVGTLMAGLPPAIHDIFFGPPKTVTCHQVTPGTHSRSRTTFTCDLP